MNLKQLPLLLFILISFSIAGQDTSDTQRPKIGLVMSGGGAKGFAYVGVLKAMEEAGIRPDYIAGTSIGSIIAGLYAIGYSADQLDTLIRNVNWDLVLSNNVPLTYISFEEKEYYNRYLITLPFIDGSLSLPSGVIEGQMLSDLLNRLTWPSMKYDNFDEYPIPFRCVSTDVSTGQVIVFDSGSLAKAMRASMSIPSAFTAVDLDSTLVVDGGILNNFPVDVVREMGADIIIGLNVSDNISNAKDIESISGILTQISMFESLKRLDSDIAACDFYLKLDLEGFGVSDFSSTKQILAIGDKIGVDNVQRFKDLAKELNIVPKKQEYIDIDINRDSIVISQIVIEGIDRVPEKVILSKLNLEIGKNTAQNEIEDAILRVYGINGFKKVFYNIKHDPASPGEFTLIVKITEKPPTNLKASVHYDNLFSAGIVLNFTLRNILGRGSRALFIGDISENPRFRFDYLKYFGNSEKLAMNFVYNFLKLDFPTYEAGKKIDELASTSHNFGLTIRTTQSLKHTFIGGIIYHSERSKYNFSKAVPESIKNGEFNNFQLVLSYIQNSLNNRNFPTKGNETIFYGKYFIDSEYKVNLNDEYKDSQESIDSLVNSSLTPGKYAQLFFDHKTFIHFSNFFQFIPIVAVGTLLSVEDTTNIFDEFNIGGSQMVNIFDTRFRGLHYSELIEANFLKLSFNFQNIFWKNLYLQYGLGFLAYYPYVPLDQLSLFDFDTMINDYTMIGYGFELRYKSVIGPISFGMSGNSQDRYIRYYFQLGFSMNYND